MKTRYLPETNEACFIPITLQIEKLNHVTAKRERKKDIKE